jgi:hypothetical protein
VNIAVACPDRLFFPFIVAQQIEFFGEVLIHDDRLCEEGLLAEYEDKRMINWGGIRCLKIYPLLNYMFLCTLPSGAVIFRSGITLKGVGNLHASHSSS